MPKNITSKKSAIITKLETTIQQIKEQPIEPKKNSLETSTNSHQRLASTSQTKPADANGEKRFACKQ